MLATSLIIYYFINDFNTLKQLDSVLFKQKTKVKDIFFLYETRSKLENTLFKGLQLTLEYQHSRNGQLLHPCTYLHSILNLIISSEQTLLRSKRNSYQDQYYSEPISWTIRFGPSQTSQLGEFPSINVLAAPAVQISH